jgi:hypothetical protein
MEVVADRVAKLSDVVAAAGVTDMAEGAEILSTSEDVNTLSAMVGLMGAEDLEHGLALARLAGEMWIVGDVTDMMQMPVISAFLEERGFMLQDMAIEQILQAASAKSLSEIMAATGDRIADYGLREAAEGAVRLAVSEGMAETSEEMAEAGVVMAAKGAAEVADAIETERVAKEIAKEGVKEVAKGAAEVGAAEVMDEVAEEMKKKSEE